MPNKIRASEATSAHRSLSDASQVGEPNNRLTAVSRLDHAIVRLLRRRARMPNNAIAAAVGVAASTCLGRIRALEQRGVIRGYHADVDLGALGLPLQAMIAVRLRASARDRLRAFTADLTVRPEVLSVYFLAGHDDFMVHVAVADTVALRDFVTDVLSAEPEVATTQTNLIFEHVRGAGSD